MHFFETRQLCTLPWAGTWSALTCPVSCSDPRRKAEAMTDGESRENSTNTNSDPADTAYYMPRGLHGYCT